MGKNGSNGGKKKGKAGKSNGNGSGGDHDVAFQIGGDIAPGKKRLDNAASKLAVGSRRPIRKGA